MKIFDVFKLCSVIIVHMNNSTQLKFIDCITNKPIILSDEMNKEVMNSIDSYIASTNLTPYTIGFSGHFVNDSEFIYATELLAIQIINLKLVSCYLTIKDNNIQLVDEITKLPVQINVESERDKQTISHMLTSAYKDTSYNFTANGYDRFVCIGNIELVNDKLTNLLDDYFYFSTAEEVTYKIYSDIYSNI